MLRSPRTCHLPCGLRQSLSHTSPHSPAGPSLPQPVPTPWGRPPWQLCLDLEPLFCPPPPGDELFPRLNPFISQSPVLLLCADTSCLRRNYGDGVKRARCQAPCLWRAVSRTVTVSADDLCCARGGTGPRGLPGHGLKPSCAPPACGQDTPSPPLPSSRDSLPKSP